MQHSCGSARHQRSAVQTSWPAHLWHRSSKVECNLAAIPPGLASLRLRTPYAAIVHVRFAPVSGGYGRLLTSALQSLPGVQDTAVPAVGADSVRHPVFVADASLLPQSRAARHRLRGSARISVIALYSYSKAWARSRAPSYPARPSYRAHSFGPSRPRPGRPSAHPRCQSPSAAWSLRSPVRCPAGASQPPHTRPPPRPRSTALRALWHWETCRRPPHQGQCKLQRQHPPQPFRLQDSQHHRPTRRPTPQPWC